jgi:hypothetical protein
MFLAVLAARMVYWRRLLNFDVVAMTGIVIRERCSQSAYLLRPKKPFSTEQIWMLHKNRASDLLPEITNINKTCLRFAPASVAYKLGDITIK